MMAQTPAARIWNNWSGAVTARPQSVEAPRNEDDLGASIQAAPGPLRIIGSGHSFTPLVASEGTILDMSAFSGLLAHDAAQSTATVGAGTKLSQLTGLLAGIGQALPNMGDIDKQAIAGALGTATHGSGLSLGAYHTLLRSIRFADGRGALREYTADRDQEMIHATGVTLGVFGALTAVTLQNVPAYRLRRRRTVIPVGDMLRDFESLMSSHRSAELFIIPFASHALHQMLNLTDKPGEFQVSEEDEDGLATLKLLRTFLKRVPWLRRKLIGSAMAKLSDEEFSGEWMKVYVTDRKTKFNEMEYHLPFEEGARALAEIIRLTEKQFPEVYFPIEVRTVQADEFWLSPFYRRKTCSIAVHHDVGESPTAFFRAAETVFRKYGGRPHWGKMHNLTAADLAAIYPRFKDAMEVRRDIDPDNRFVSPYIARLLGVGR
ncbi:D-arabinono-1,4-lactone oxidase [Rhizobium sp. PAMB 3182]